MWWLHESAVNCLLLLRENRQISVFILHYNLIVLSVDFLCDGSISSIHLCWEQVFLNKYRISRKWLLIYFFVKMEDTSFPLYVVGQFCQTDADEFCLTRGHSGAFGLVVKTSTGSGSISDS